MKLHQILLSLLTIALMAGAGNALAEARLDLNLSNDAARLKYMTPITSSGMYVDFGYLYHRERGDVLNGGLLLVGNASGGPNTINAGLGVQAYILHVDSKLRHGPVTHNNSNAIALGGFVGYQFPTANRLGLSAHVYYSPDIVALGGLTRFLEYGVRASYQVLRNADVYVGFRQLKGDYGSGYHNYDTGIHVGLQLRF